MSAGAHIRINAGEGGRWTWSYVEPDSDIELHSNETYSSREDAANWAKRAYPDLDVADTED